MVNRITIVRSDFELVEHWEENIAKTIKLLLENNYIMTVRMEDKYHGIVVIEFMKNFPEYGDRLPYWLLPEEEETVVYQGEKL